MLGPATPLAEATEIAGRLVARGRWPTESGAVRQHHALWMDIAARRDPADLTLLLETLFLNGRPAQWRKRLRALVAFARDPRLLPGLFGALETPPCPVNQTDLWDSFFELVKVLDDPRLGALARDLVGMSPEDDPARPLRARAAALVCLAVEQPLEPDEVALCRAILEALQQGWTSSSTLSCPESASGTPEAAWATTAACPVSTN